MKTNNRRHLLVSLAFAIVSIVAAECWTAAVAGEPQAANSAALNAAARPSVLSSQIQDALKRGDIPALRQLLASARPSGTMSFAGRPSLAALSQNTQYEELKACGFYPQETRLACTVEIKQSTGYGGPIGDFGSMEYVTFCMLTGPAGGYPSWRSLGIGSVQVHDESASGNGQPPWEYAVYRDFGPFGGMRDAGSFSGGVVTAQTSGGSFLVEAILSFNAPVSDCYATQAYGNTLYFIIRADLPR